MNRAQVDDGAPEDLVRLAEIGAGGSAIVYRAMHTGSGELVALKLWRDPLDEQTRERFFRETELLRRLAGHPNIVRLKRAEAPAGAPAWITTELCEESLAVRLVRGPVPPAEAFAIADDVLNGLAAIHAAGHLHRDLKPQNMLLTGGRAKLCDLGISGAVGTQTSNTTAGTGPYIAPELAHQQPDVGSDIYAAALSLDELFGPGASPEVSKLLTRAASTRPSDRPVDAATFRQALASLQSPTSSISSVTPTAPVVAPVPTVVPADVVRSGNGRNGRRVLRPLVLTPVVIVALLAGATATAWAQGWTPFDARGGVRIAATPVTAPTGVPATTAPSAAPSSPGAVPSGSSLVTGSAGSTAGGGISNSQAPAFPDVGSGGGSTAAAKTTKAAPAPARTKTKKPVVPAVAATTAAAKPKADGQSCYDTAITGSLTLDTGATTSGGPNYLHAPCHDIHLKLTAVEYRTYARSCLETSGGETTSCSSWKLLEDGGAWNTMSTSVPDGTRWRLDMKAEGSGPVDFLFTG